MTIVTLWVLECGGKNESLSTGGEKKADKHLFQV